MASDLNAPSNDLSVQTEEWLRQSLRLIRNLQEKLDLKHRTQQNPYAMMLASAGVGYLLGGGLVTRLSGRMLGLGLRLAMLPLMQDEWGALTEEVMGRSTRAAAPIEGNGPEDVYE